MLVCHTCQERERRSQFYIHIYRGMDVCGHCWNRWGIESILRHAEPAELTQSREDAKSSLQEQTERTEPESSSVSSVTSCSKS